MNRQLTIAINFYNLLHGLQAGHGMGTTSLEAKLLQQLTDMRKAVLFGVFLDLQKAYNALDWDRFLDILAVYVIGPSRIQLLWTYWDQLTMMARARG